MGKQFLHPVPRIFENFKSSLSKQQEGLVNQFYHQIKQLKFELDWQNPPFSYKVRASRDRAGTSIIFHHATQVSRSA